jgi:DNA mismatch endonuclease (patch repair protein)
LPKIRRAYWRAKFARNVARDEKAKRELKKAGWTVIVIWECEAKSAKKLERIVQRIARIPKLARGGQNRNNGLR